MILPDGFIAQIEALRKLGGGESLDSLLHDLAETEPSVGLRRNCLKSSRWTAKSIEPVEWLPKVGITVVGERPRFTLDPAIHQGRYYVQDPSSMVIARVVEHVTELLGTKDIVYLDACAAPGGKTTAAIDSLGRNALVIANERDQKRVMSLAENLAKWGAPNVVVTCDDARRFDRMGEFADIVAADVPCSGEGMMRKDPEAVAQWSRALVENCAALQREIVGSLWAALKPGGYFIYSTCTFNRDENEENVEWMIKTLGAEPVELPALTESVAGAIGSDIPAARFIPGRVRGEGLFMALLRKPGDWRPISLTDNRMSGKRIAKTAKKADTGIDNITSWLSSAADFTLSADKNGAVFAIPTRYEGLIDKLSRTVNVKTAGTEVATLKGRDYLPTQQYVLSTHCRAEADNAPFVDVVEVDYPTAIAYLRGEAVAIDAKKGIVLLTYGGHPLGVVKNLGNRANNRYPAAWAIKTTHIPDSFDPIVE